VRIAMLTESFYPTIGGGEKRYYEIAKRLSHRHEIHVYTVCFCGLKQEETIDGIHIHRCTRVSSRFDEKGEHAYTHGPKFSYEILSKQAKNLINYDIIDFNQWPIFLPSFLSLLLRLNKIPSILTWHEVRQGVYSDWNSMEALIGRLFDLLNSKIPALHMTVSNVIKNQLVSSLRISPQKIFVISNGVDLKCFRKNYTKIFGRITYAGQLLRHKHVDWLILAYTKIKKVFPEAELHIVGEGPMFPSLKALAEELQIEGITFHGYIPYAKLVEMLKTSWIFVLPSTREGQGITLLEAMAAGTPPISVDTEYSGVKDVIKDCWNGFLAQPNVNSLAKKIMFLLNSKDIHKKVSKNGLNYVKAFDWDIISRRVEHLYEYVVK